MHARVTCLIPVTATSRDGSKWLTISVPQGWEDCQKICRKVLEYAGEHYTFTGWNSDRNEAFFKLSKHTAKIL
jgi:hypothetical protein